MWALEGIYEYEYEYIDTISYYDLVKLIRINIPKFMFDKPLDERIYQTSIYGQLFVLWRQAGSIIPGTRCILLEKITKVKMRTETINGIEFNYYV